ncbi:hypothetical protein [Georgenia alba]|uniref:DUF3558 domain-containing protein n=1 Tax=Georgenia alba TaxID=2233858 RepID=A0ABW2QAD3_9MICO
MRSVTATTTALALAAVLTACGAQGSGAGGPEPGAGPTDDESGEMVSGPLPEWLCDNRDEAGDGATAEGTEDPGEPDDSETADGLVLTDTDVTEATWETPSGFTEASGYHEDNPVEDLAGIWVAEPSDGSAPTLNVVNVVRYTGLEWDPATGGGPCDPVPMGDIEARLARYMDQIGAEPLSDAELTTLAGLPAVTQRVSLADYDYVGWWLFSQQELLHVYCQWTDETYRPVIEAGCDELVASVRLP